MIKATIHVLSTNISVPPHRYAMALFSAVAVISAIPESMAKHGPTQVTLKFISLIVAATTASVDLAGASWFLQHLVMFRFELLCQRCPSGRAQLPNLRCITAGSEFVRLWDSHEASSLTMTRSCSHCLPPRKTPMGNNGKKRIRPKKTYINWPTPNQSDQLAFRNQANASAKVPGTVSDAGSCVGSSMTGSTGAECAKSFVCSSKSGYLGGSLEVCPLRALGKQVEIRRNYCVKNKWTTGKPNIFCEQILHRSS